MNDDTENVFTNGVQPLLDFKTLQGINSIFIVYGQSGSGKSFTLIGEKGHLGILPMSLKYLLDKPEIVEKIELSSIEAYGIKATKIGFYDLVSQLKTSQKIDNNPNTKEVFDVYTSNDNPRLNSGNAESVEITHDNCYDIIAQLQNVSHMAPTLKNPHSSRGHTVYFCKVKIVELEPVFFICVDLAGSEGQTALGTKDEFINGLKFAMSKGKLDLNKKQLLSFEEMYKIRSLEAGCINNGLTQLQSIFSELIKKKISKSQGLGLRKVLSSFISLNSAYSILFTLSASANNNKITKATLNFAKQTQLVKVETKKAKKKIDKDKIIKELNELIASLRNEMAGKDATIEEMKHQQTLQVQENGHSRTASKAEVFARVDELNKQLNEAIEDEALWHVDLNNQVSNKNVSEEEMKKVFEEFDLDNSGTIDNKELQAALVKMGAENVTAEQIDTLVKEIDINHDGQIDFEEFKLLFTQTWFIDQYENRLVQATHRYMSTMNIVFDEDDPIFDGIDFGDDDENGNDDNETKTDDNNNDENDQNAPKESGLTLGQTIKTADALENELNEMKRQYELEIAALKEKLESEKVAKLTELERENERLKNQVNRLETDLNDNMAMGGDGTVITQFKPGVREIVNIQVGQCGNQIGNVFWTTMCREHNIALKSGSSPVANKRYKIDVYFNEVSINKYVPRSVMVDLEPSTLDVIRGSNIGTLFKPDNFISGSTGASNNWAKGHYTEGAELVDEIIDMVRKETELCDCLQGYQVTHSLGGGTGSGLGTLLLMKIRDNYPDRIIATFSVYPSPKVSDIVVEPYNATLSIHQLLENSDETFIIDNEALYNIANNILKLQQPKYAEINEVIASVMSGVTASLRFSGKLNGDLRKLGVNLVPFPRLHFFAIAHSPLFNKEDAEHSNLTIQEVTDQMWSSRNFLSNIKVQNGKYLSASCSYRGLDISTQEVDDELRKVQNKMADNFVEWIPNNIKSSIINVAPLDTSISGTFVANNTSLRSVFQRISTQFAKLYKRKAFLHWYKGEGMDELEFQEADKDMRDLVTEYQDKEDVVIGDDNDEDEDGDGDDNDDDDDDDE